MKETKPGGWYFFVVCSNPECRKDIIFQEAPAPEKIERPMVRGVKATCPFCHKEDTYPAARVDRGVVEDNTE